eukprot:m.182613 g.182613  ORF g.182613 m.182613 type:complete len:58 (+) comp16643_c0_seq4:46-219(+)
MAEMDGLCASVLVGVVLVVLVLLSLNSLIDMRITSALIPYGQDISLSIPSLTRVFLL